MVTRQILDLVIGVRVPVSQPNSFLFNLLGSYGNRRSMVIDGVPTRLVKAAPCWRKPRRS